MQLKIRPLNPDYYVPTKAHDSDAGFDLYNTKDQIIFLNQIVPIDIGISIEIPDGCFGMIKDRSSMAARGLRVGGGIIDSGYRGEITIFIQNMIETHPSPIIYKGEKIAQLIILPLAPISSTVEVVSELSNTERGEKGFGSSDYGGSVKEEANVIRPEGEAGSFLNLRKGNN